MLSMEPSNSWHFWCGQCDYVELGTRWWHLSAVCFALLFRCTHFHPPRPRSQNHNMLRAIGFKAHQLGCLKYYTCNISSTPGQQGQQGYGQPPILLLHGVGCGLLAYFKVLLTIASTGKCRQVLLDSGESAVKKVTMC